MSGVPTVPRRFLGDAIRRLRLDSGKTLDETAEVIGKSRVQLIRVIDGVGTISARDLAVLLDLLGAKPKERRDLLALGVQARKRSSRRPFTDLLPKEFMRQADLEAMALGIRSYSRGGHSRVVADSRVCRGADGERRRRLVGPLVGGTP